MSDECKVCQTPCDFLQLGLAADAICSCCRVLAAGLYPVTSTVNFSGGTWTSSGGNDE